MPGKFKTLTEAQRAEVETLAAVLTAAQMADYFGIGRTTLFSLMDRDPDIAERYKRGKARAIGAIAQSLLEAAARRPRSRDDLADRLRDGQF